MPESKLAVFVEGQTEQIFVKKLVEEIAGAHNVKVLTYKASGGGASGARQIVQLQAARADPAKRYYVLIVDCTNGDRVASDILDRYQTLVQQDFKAIIGISDVYPRPRVDIGKLYRVMAGLQRTSPIVVDNVLAVMEVEAWFLGEHHHLAKIGAGIAVADVIHKLGFDPSTDNMEDRHHPAGDLDAVYQLGGRSYNKKRNTVEATVDALDYENLYLTLPGRMGSLRLLVDALDRFLAS
jgi:hypothetical protein